MQHWTLCEALCIAWASGVRTLNYIDAHAMAPLAKVRSPQKVHQGSGIFSRVQDGLPGRRSAYECAWHKITPEPSCGYPNSANFVTQIWKGDYSLLLCEQDAGIATDIEPWLCDVALVSRCKEAELHPGDWRCRFNRGLPRPAWPRLSEDALTFLSFDPNKYDIAGPPDHSVIDTWKDSFDLFPQDLDLIVKAICGIEGPVLIQLSTYDRGRRDENPQCKVIRSVAGQLTRQTGFCRTALVRADGNMMSLIYTRNVGWHRELAELPTRFTEWLRPFKR